MTAAHFISFYFTKLDCTSFWFSLLSTGFTRSTIIIQRKLSFEPNKREKTDKKCSYFILLSILFLFFQKSWSHCWNWYGCCKRFEGINLSGTRVNYTTYCWHENKVRQTSKWHRRRKSRMQLPIRRLPTSKMICQLRMNRHWIVHWPVVICLLYWESHTRNSIRISFCNAF